MPGDLSASARDVEIGPRSLILAVDETGLCYNKITRRLRYTRRIGGSGDVFSSANESYQIYLGTGGSVAVDREQTRSESNMTIMRLPTVIAQVW